MAPSPQRVAVIGAGVSGLAAARHLQESGLDVVVYERSSRPGGVWAYDERKPPEPRYPSILPSLADSSFENVEGIDSAFRSKPSPGKELVKSFNSGEESVDSIHLRHAPPGPAYDGLTTNISTKLQKMKDHPWKDGTGDFVNVRVVGDYLADYAKNFHVEEIVRYRTKVASVEKVGGSWRIESSQLVSGQSRDVQFVNRREVFDKVVVASGHYHACRVPDIDGLAEWKTAWPERIMHSKAYRQPTELEDQTVLLIGASTSSTDIAREIDGVAKKVYQSSRGGQFDLPLSFLPPNTSRIGECSSFQFDPKDNGRGTVYLKDGSILPGIDKVVVCTGYHISYPFLREYHDDFLKAEQADERILVTDGTQVHNLHKDIFYIPDPTLAFVGTSYYVATMSFFEFQAIAVAAVFSGRAKLPSGEEMREEYRAKVVNKGYGRAFHALHGIEAETVKELVEWINADAELSGAPKIQGHSDEWMKEDKVKLEKLRKRFAQKQQDNETQITVGWLGTKAN
ncbi:hypothetical protein CJF32_00000663 [Rutstroemia sp. NJR-2017a WRK4]|nr:hypothetical protein CJF32_00000663 [Rutstroemia sp. NJR-2017a WRK4]